MRPVAPCICCAAPQIFMLVASDGVHAWMGRRRLLRWGEGGAVPSYKVVQVVSAEEPSPPNGEDAAAAL